MPGERASTLQAIPLTTGRNLANLSEGASDQRPTNSATNIRHAPAIFATAITALVVGDRLASATPANCPKGKMHAFKKNC